MAHPQDRGLGIDQIRQALEVRGNQPPRALTDKDFANQGRFGFADPQDRPSAASARAQEISRAITPYWQDPDLQSYDHPLRAEETLGQQVGPVAVDQARAELSYDFPSVGEGGYTGPGSPAAGSLTAEFGLPIDYDERPYETLNVAPGEQPGRYSAPYDMLSEFGSPGVMDPDPAGVDFALSDWLTNTGKTNKPAADLFRHTLANINTIDPDAWNYVNRHDPSTRPPGELAFYDYGIHASQPPPTQGQFTNAELAELIAHEAGLHGTVKAGDTKRSSPYSNVQAQLEHAQGIDIPGFTMGLPPANLSRTALRNEEEAHIYGPSRNPRGHTPSEFVDIDLVTGPDHPAAGIFGLLSGDISAYERERELQQQDTDQRIREGARFTPFGNRDLVFEGKNIGTVRQSYEDRLERMDLEEREAFGPQTNTVPGLGGWNTRGVNTRGVNTRGVNTRGLFTDPMGASVRNLTADAGPGYRLFGGDNVGIGNLSPRAGTQYGAFEGPGLAVYGRDGTYLGQEPVVGPNPEQYYSDPVDSYEPDSGDDEGLGTPGASAEGAGTPF